MRRPSARCTPNSVVPLEVAAYGRGAAGGRVPIGAQPGVPIACSVQGRSARIGDPEHGGELQVTAFDVVCHDDPGLEIRDTLSWTDPSPPRTLVVVGVVPQAGRQRTWVVNCEEIL